MVKLVPAVSTWNKLPDQIKSVRTKEQFKNAMRTYNESGGRLQ
jgi:hypothetical protein